MSDFKKQIDAWNEWVAANERAQRSGDLTDGVEAGRAWSKFIDLFVGGRAANDALPPQKKTSLH